MYPHGDMAMKVLVAVAEDYCQDQVLAYLTGRVWDQNTVFRLLHVVAESNDKRGATAASKAEARDSAHFLEQMAEKLAVLRPSVKVEKAMVKGDPTEQILHSAREWNADLIVIGAHGRKGLERLFLGSVSQSVTNECPCSITVVKLTGAGLDLRLTDEEDMPQSVCSINLDKCN
jgi:nucleotide-binding universal stress UspA family protein